MIPALNDSELERVLKEGAAAGAETAGYVLLRLPLELKDLFTEWLEAHYPTKAKHVLSLIQQTREGGLYQAEFGKRMRGTGQYAELLKRRFRAARRRYGLDRERPPLDTTRFRIPPRSGDQMRLFG
jgi:DNA repair photolyase